MLWWSCAWHSRTGKIKAVDSGKVDKAREDRRIKAVDSGKVDKAKEDRRIKAVDSGKVDKAKEDRRIKAVNGMEDKTVNTAIITVMEITAIITVMEITATTATMRDITMNGVQAPTRMMATGSDDMVVRGARRRQVGMATIRTRGKLKEIPAFRLRGGRVAISIARTSITN